MKLFLDTSSLFKLYHREADSHTVENLFIHNIIKVVFLSELAKVEFASTVWKKLRTNEITQPQANSLLGAFENDFGKYVFITIDSAIVEQARTLLTRYGPQGLRTLDSIQLSTALSLQGQVDLYKTSDQLLHSFFLRNHLLPDYSTGLCN